MVHGYKRFADQNVIYIRAPLVAIVGPNEAGKTSLLEATAHLSKELQTGEEPDDPEEGRFARREFSGRVEPGHRGDDDNPIIVSARFSLENADRDDLGGLLDNGIEYKFELRKRANGEIKHLLTPQPRRDLEPRAAVTKKFKLVVEKGWLSADPDHYQAEEEESAEELEEPPTFRSEGSR